MACRVSSRSLAMTEPEPFLGPLFFLAMSLVHLKPADRHRSQGSDFEHLTFLRRQASHGRRESIAAPVAAKSSGDSAIHMSWKGMDIGMGMGVGRVMSERKSGKDRSAARARVSSSKSRHNSQTTAGRSWEELSRFESWSCLAD